MKATSYRAITVLTTLALLSACGGGGGGATSPDPEPIIERTISGSVNKGLISNGTLSLHEINNGSISTSASTTATTGSDGSYSAVISSRTIPLFFTLSADNTALMRCDAVSGCDSNGDKTLDIPFGTDYPLPTGFILEGIISTVDGNQVTANITPLSHLASHYSKNTGLDASNIQNTIETIEALFNISNIQTNQATDITNATQFSAETNPNNLKLGIINAALAEIAASDYNGNLTTMLNTLSDNFTLYGGELMLNNGSEDQGGPSDAEHITMAEITQAMLDTLDSPLLTASNSLATALNNETLAFNNYATTSAKAQLTSTDIIVNPINSAKLEAAKGIVQTVNNWSVSFNELKTSHDIFHDKMALAGDLLRPASASASSVLAETTAALGRAYALHKTQTSTVGAAGSTITLSNGLVFILACDGSYSGSRSGHYQIIDKTLYFTNNGASILFDPHRVDNFNLTIDNPILTANTNAVVVGNLSGTPTGNITTGSITISSVVTTAATCIIDQQLASWVNNGHLSNVTGMINFGSVDETASVSGTATYTNGTLIHNHTFGLTLTLPPLNSQPLTTNIGGQISNENVEWTLHNAGARNSTITFNRSSALTEQMVTHLSFDNIDFALESTLSQTIASNPTNPASFDGSMVLNIIPTLIQKDLSPAYNYNPETFLLDGIFSNASGTTVDATLTLNISNATSFQVYESIVGSYIKDDTKLTLNLGSTDWERHTFNNGSVDVVLFTGGVNNSYTDTDPLDPYTDIDDYITRIIKSPTPASSTITDVGIYDTNLNITYGSSGTLSGTLNLADVNIDNRWGEHINNWRALDMEISYLEQIQGLPEAKITASGSRSGLDTGTTSATLEYENITITASANYHALTGISEPRFYVIDNSDPNAPVQMIIEMDISGAVKTGTIIVDAVEVASISSEFGGMLIGFFADGSFMSIGL